MFTASWFVVAGFIGGIAAMHRLLKRQDEDGHFDMPSSSVAKPGMRLLFDYGPRGWSRDGARQRTPAS